MEMDFETLQAEYERLKQEYENIKKAKEEYDEAIKKAYADPELRPSLKAMLKKVAGVEIDDPPHEKAVKSEIQRLEEELKKLRVEKEQEQRQKIESELRSVFTEYGIEGDELKRFQQFVIESGLTPTTIQGWKIAAQNYRRSQMAEPLLGKPKTFKSELSLDEFAKSPADALDKFAMSILAGRK